MQHWQPWNPSYVSLNRPIYFFQEIVLLSHLQHYSYIHNLKQMLHVKLASCMNSFTCWIVTMIYKLVHSHVHTYIPAYVYTGISYCQCTHVTCYTTVTTYSLIIHMTAVFLCASTNSLGNKLILSLKKLVSNHEVFNKLYWCICDRYHPHILYISAETIHIFMG